MIEVIVDNSFKEKERVYPWIGESRVNKGLIVLFTDKNSGTILGVDYQDYFVNDIGCYKEVWDESVFTPITYDITLRNI